MRTKAPEQHRAEYNWLKPSEVAERIGVDSPAQVRELIRSGHLKALDVSRGKVARYRISPEAVEEFNEESERRVAEMVEASEVDAA